MDNRYYFNKIENNTVYIVDGEATHLSKVRRCKLGDEIIGFNGDGYDYVLKIESITKDMVKANIISKHKNKSLEENNSVVYLSMLKNDALVTAIDNLAELNVKHVKLFKSDFSIASVDSKKLEKLNNICIQASKQCERADIMKVSIIDKKDIENDVKSIKNVFFAYENSTNPIKPFKGDFAVIVGPEGGFSESENNYFSKFANNITLSKTILRAPVACVVAVSMLKAVSV